MSTINDTDLFLVQRGQDSYKQSAVDLMSTILDTDYMLIQRGQDSYKVTCEDVKDQLGGGGITSPVLDSVVLSQDGSPDANRFTSKSFTSTTTNSGGEATTLEMTGTVTGALGIKAGSDPITTNAYPGTSSTDVVLTLEGEANLGTVIEDGDTVTANVSYTPETDTISSVASSTATTYETFGSSQADANWDQSSATQYDVGTAPPSGSAATILTKAAAGAVFGIEGNFVSATKNIAISVSDDGTNWTSLGDYSQLDLNVDEGNGFVMTRLYLRAAWGVGAGTEYWYVHEAKTVSTLTLPSEKDIQLFQRDDIVQSTKIWNQDQTWSAGTRTGDGTDASGKSVATVFNGITNVSSDNWYLNTSNPAVTSTLTFATPIPYTKVELQAYANNADSGAKLFANGVDVTSSVGNSSSQWQEKHDITSVLSGSTLNSVGVGAGSTNAGVLYAVYVDDRLLVDTGIAGETGTDIKVTATNVSAKTITVDGGKWSDGTTTGTSQSNLKQFSNWDTGISGTAGITTSNFPLSEDDNNAYYTRFGGITFSIPIPVPAGSVVSVDACNEDFAGGHIYFYFSDGTSEKAAQSLPKANSWSAGPFSTCSTVANASDRFLTGFEPKQDPHDPATRITAGMKPLKIDGSFVSSTQLLFGDTKVSTTTAKQGSGTVSDITGAQVTVSPFTDNCFKEGQYLTVNKTIDVDPKTDKITSYDDTTKVITVDGDQDLLQFAAGDSVFMTDNSGSGASTKTGYKLTTTDIQSVVDAVDYTFSAGYNAGSGGANIGNAFNNNSSNFATIRQSEPTDLTSNGVFFTGTVPTIVAPFYIHVKTHESGPVEVYLNGTATGTNVSNNKFEVDLSNFTLPLELNKVNFVRPSGAGDSGPTVEIYGFYIGDTYLTAGATWSGYTTLTFTGAASTNPDLKYFKQNDIVRRPYSSYGNGETNGAYPQTKLFDGKVSKNTDCCLANTTNSFIWEYPGGIPFTTLEISGIGRDQIVKINDLEVQNTGDFNTWGTGADCVKITPTFTGNIGNRLTKIELPKWQDGAALAGIYIDGTLLVDGPTVDVKVVSVDTTNNKMTVSGGNWLGSDGSASGTATAGWNQANTWSDNVVATGHTWNASHSPTLAFDGNTTIAADKRWIISTSAPYSVNVEVEITFPGLTAGDKVEFLGKQSPGGGTVRFNGTAVTGIFESGVVAGEWNTLGTALAGDNTMTIGVAGPNTDIYAFRVAGKLLVDTGIPGDPGPSGDTKVEYQTTGGVGTIAAGGIDLTNRTITLTDSEVGAARWIDTNKAGTEFRVATATKPAVATTAYLKFSADGAVTGYQATPVEPRAMDNKTNPKLTFPATFPDTGQAPDTEFPGTQTYIQTSVQLKNSAGNSATVKSNTLVPQTNIRSIGPGEVENNADDVKAMGMQIATHDQRVADHTAAMRQQAIADFEANLRRYSS